jgi:hypothetical protein
MVQTGEAAFAHAGDQQPQPAPQPAVAAPAGPAPAVTTSTSATLGEALDRLQSYRVNVKLTAEGGSEGASGPVTVDIVSEHVSPDRYHFSASFPAGTAAHEVILIGDLAWVKQDGAWRQQSLRWIGGKSPRGFRICPAFRADQIIFCGPFPLSTDPYTVAGLQSRPGQREQVNGVSTLYYTIDPAPVEPFPALAALYSGGAVRLPGDVPAAYAVELWVAEDGFSPVKMLVRGSGDGPGQHYTFTLEFNLTGVNDGSLRIEPPAAGDRFSR